MENAQDLVIFAQVVENGSFSRAARKLKIANSSVTKRIQALESRLGVRLLLRSTRRLQLTEEGRALYQRCARIKSEVEGISEEASSFKEVPQGTIRLSVPPLLAHTCLAPHLTGFLTRFPNVSLQVDLTERESDLRESGFDLSLRTGELRDSSDVAQRLCAVTTVLCASPTYLGQHGRPKRPSDLEHFNYLGWMSPDRRTYEKLVFRKGKKTFTSRIRGNFSSSDAMAIREAAIHGAGITLLPDIAIAQDIESGLLEAVLTEYTCFQYPLYLIYHRREHQPAKIKVAIDFLKSIFSQPVSRFNREADPG